MGRLKGRKLYKENKPLCIALLAVLILAVVVVLSCLMVYMSLQKNKIAIVPEDEVDPTASEVNIAQQQQQEEDVFNVLLIGTDARDPDAENGRSDTMMLVSFNKYDNKSTIVSFLRDSLVEIDGYGQSKLGHTLAYGGVGLTINTINQNFDLDIQNYITINFENLVNIIDKLGGIEVYISAEEAEYYRAIGMAGIEEGLVTLDGSQALAHTRNRTLGNDFERTRRQRSVMYGIYNKVMAEKDPTTILPLIEYCLTQVQTNMSVTDIYEWAKVVLGIEHLTTQQAAVPKEGTFTDEYYNNMAVLVLDFEANKEHLQELLY